MKYTIPKIKYLPLPQTIVLMVEMFGFIKVKNGEKRGNIKFKTGNIKGKDNEREM